MVQHNNYPADKVVSDFRINISNQMATMPARVLPAPTVAILQLILVFF